MMTILQLCRQKGISVKFTTVDRFERKRRYDYFTTNFQRWFFLMETLLIRFRNFLQTLAHDKSNKHQWYLLRLDILVWLTSNLDNIFIRPVTGRPAAALWFPRRRRRAPDPSVCIPRLGFPGHPLCVLRRHRGLARLHHPLLIWPYKYTYRTSVLKSRSQMNFYRKSYSNCSTGKFM